MTTENRSVGRSFGDLPPLIPRDILFGNPDRTDPQISPDGRYLAYLAPDESDVLQVWMRTLRQQDDSVLTADKKRGVRDYVWTYDGEQLIYLQDSDGDENWHFYAVNINSNLVRDLTPFQGVQAHLVALDPKFPNQLLVGMNLNDRRKFDVYRINLQNGAVDFDTENPGNVVAWTADLQFTVRAATAATDDGGWDLMVREVAAKPWKTMRHWGPDDHGAAVTFSEDGKTLYLVGSHGSNTMRLIALNPATDTENVIAEDPQYDAGEMLVHPVKRIIQAVAFYRDKLQWQVLDNSIEADFETIAGVHRGEFRVHSRDLADETWLVSYITDDGPVYFYVYDRSSKKSTLLFSHQPKLEELLLAQVEPVSCESRDGLTLRGYLATPRAIPAKMLPTVLLVHGGPWGRATWGYDPIVQWLANRGYAVLQVNFRGSVGYGKSFHNAGDREWGGKMHDDLIDGVNWVVKKGVADPQMIAIMGGSYGGYATLVGLAFTPDVFAAGVDIVGPSNLVTLLQSFPPYWTPMKGMFAKRVGDPEQEEDFLKSRSPLFLADRIKAPLIIGQGANDPRVKQAESDQIVEAMRKANRLVEYIVYEDEGHGFARPENRLHFFSRAEEFLARHLGGRFEPMGNLRNHSGSIS